MANLKTKRTPALPNIPTEDELKDYDRVVKWRRGHLTVLKQLHEDVYDDLVTIGASNVANHNPVTVNSTSSIGLYVYSNQLLFATVIPTGIPLDTLGAASNTTTLNANVTRHGLCPRLSGNSATYLSGTGVFSEPGGGTPEHASVTVNDTASVNLTIDATQLLSAVVIPAGIKLDDFGAPDNNTDLNSNSNRHGLCPRLSGTASTFLNGVGNFASASNAFGAWVSSYVVNTVYTAATDGFVLASANCTSMFIVSANSTKAIAIAPTAANHTLSLCCPIRKGDTWQVTLGGTNGTYNFVRWLPLGA